MPLFGAHMSISGGYNKAVEAAAVIGFDCVQLFSKNSNQWKAKPITDEEAEKFQFSLRTNKIIRPLIHDSYLINLASPKDELYQKSIAAFVEEMVRAEKLGVSHLVMHPGSYTESSESEGIQKASRAFDEIFQKYNDLIQTAENRKSVMILLETTAGQGTNLGSKFEHLRDIIAGCQKPERFGVCVDTCHIFAAGYPLIEKEDYEQTMQKFEDVIGLKHLVAFHLNDSIKGLGSRVDRHAHIGCGALGLEPFRHIVNDKRFQETPMYLETPKGATMIDDKEIDWDLANLNMLKNLQDL
ncbi:MAG: deoxyribonuclease IV [Planctomycetaceae bacterium]|jgi:deoxyribonuclease-4|nr:deoxyribonuclease IV [Planctomycetaceae bacterium]